MKNRLKSGTPWIWLNAGAVAVCISLLLVLIAVTAVRGLAQFWPAQVHEMLYQLPDGGAVTVVGQILAEERGRILLRTGNRATSGSELMWILEPRVLQHTTPLSMAVFGRKEGGVFFGKIIGVKTSGDLIRTRDVWGELQARLRWVQGVDPQIDQGVDQGVDQGDQGPDRGSVLVLVADGTEIELPINSILDAWQPNRMHYSQRLVHFFGQFWSFIIDGPHVDGVGGGVYPAIFGTVVMVLLMTVFLMPVGVAAGIYLREYAHQGWLARTARVAVRSLAGVPSIVYGVFGLGFFVYTLGGGLDRLVLGSGTFPPVFGTGGLLWASLTLALLSLPVVIVATEESLSLIPRGIREGSFALGATQWETLRHMVLPIAGPGILTGLILAVARAAGAVAPLVLLGVVQSAALLPFDGTAPFLHLERKFMHLGFHVYDAGFLSLNIDATRAPAFASAILLVAVIFSLNFAAIRLRGSLRFKSGD